MSKVVLELKPMNVCPNCGKPMTLHFSGNILVRVGPLNWYECNVCGRPEQHYEVITSTDPSGLGYT